MTLCDFQTPIWLSPALAQDGVLKYIRFHTGAPIAKARGDAAFVFASAGDGILPLTQFAQGTHEYPDRSATLVLQVKGFLSSGNVELRGPGLEAPAAFGVAGLGDEFWHAMAENHTLFPLGVDVIFVSPDAIAACPRSTAIRLLESA